MDGNGSNYTSRASQVHRAVNRFFCWVTTADVFISCAREDADDRAWRDQDSA